MKVRMKNNYDGFMYTVHELSLGTGEYQGTLYNLDNPIERKELLKALTNDGILYSLHINNEVQYRFHDKELLAKTFTKKSINDGFLQEKTIILNLKLLAIIS